MEFIRQKDIEVIEPDKKNRVFLVPYFRDRCWRNHKEVSDKIKNTVFLNLLTVFRYDGKMGFIGGGLERGETLREALEREVYEEAGIVLEPYVVVPLARFTSEDSNIVSYSVDLYNGDAKQWRETVQSAEHFGSEICGLNTLQIHAKTENAIDKIYWSGSARLEVKALLEALYEEVRDETV